MQFPGLYMFLHFILVDTFIFPSATDFSSRFQLHLLCKRALNYLHKSLAWQRTQPWGPVGD